MSTVATPRPSQVVGRSRRPSVVRGGAADPRWVIGVEDLPGTAAALAQLSGFGIAAVREREVVLARGGSAPATIALREAREGELVEASVCRLSFTVPSRRALADVVSRAVGFGVAPVRALRGETRTVAHLEGPEGIEIGFEHRAASRLAPDGEQLRAFAPELLLGRDVHSPVAVRLGEVTVASTRHTGPAVRDPAGFVLVSREVLPTRAVLLGVA